MKNYQVQQPVFFWVKLIKVLNLTTMTLSLYAHRHLAEIKKDFLCYTFKTDFLCETAGLATQICVSKD